MYNTTQTTCTYIRSIRRSVRSVCQSYTKPTIIPSMVWSRKCKQTMDHIIHLIPRILDNGYMAIFHKIKRDYQIPMKQWLIEWRLVWIVLTDLNITDSSLDPSHTHRALTERKSQVVICIDLWWEEINIWLGLSQNTLWYWSLTKNTATLSSSHL